MRLLTARCARQLLSVASMSAARRPATLLTFDVDGTLVKGSGQSAEASAHARAFAHALGHVLGNGSPTPLPAEALPGAAYHGSTDGLICLRLAQAALGVPPEKAAPELPRCFRAMYEYCAALPDAEMTRGIEPLPGVLDELARLAAMRADERAARPLYCGLVTGNVEGIARKKMRAVGVLRTGALSPAVPEQSWDGEEDAAFLGGFGSDYCSNDIADFRRNHLDRAEQLRIAASRVQSVLPADASLARVVHIGDAPADVLAARHCALSGSLGDGVVVGCVGVATGSYAAEELAEAAGEPEPGRWEPVILEDGIADPAFQRACGLE